LLLTDFLVVLSESTAVVIVPWWITSSGGIHAIAAFSVALAVFAFIAAPAVSPFGDTICKSKQITWGLVCLSGVAALQVSLAVGGVFSLPTLIALALVHVLAVSFVDPARDVILAELVARESVPAAIRLRKITQAVASILGPLVAGFALGALGVVGALCIYAGLRLTSALLAWNIPRRPGMDAPLRGFANWWGDLRAGLSAKWLVPMERGWTVVNFVVWIFQGPAVGLLIPLKVHALGLAGNWLGICLGALSAGVLLGSAFGSQMLVNRFGRYRVRVALGFLEGIALAVAGFVSSPYLMTVALFTAGFCHASMALVGATHRALAIPQTYRVRMYAAASMSTQIAGAIGPGLVGMALGAWSVAFVYTAWGLLMATSVLGFLLVPRLKEFLSLDHEHIADWYQRQYPSVFK
jgi:MFS family permease